MSNKNTESNVLYFYDKTYANRKEEESIIGIIFDCKLSFYGNIKGLSKRSLKNSLLYPGLSLRFITKSVIFKSIIKSQFSYCRLV